MLESSRLLEEAGWKNSKAISDGSEERLRITWFSDSIDCLGSTASFGDSLCWPLRSKTRAFKCQTNELYVGRSWRESAFFDFSTFPAMEREVDRVAEV